ncbi:signal peptidase I [Algisphaera agarilytica]|uniref:Signal peptidase I n=1 Tax=Algisphaera agarilytica TaxID=1385975 RepID=A0A7X0LJ93_9BACT|nr:signal peptidase I [Algisphaera agarilytica]MBB6429075.1 signal peptidase I [Algisphaera agarilytica]
MTDSDSQSASVDDEPTPAAKAAETAASPTEDASDSDKKKKKEPPQGLWKGWIRPLLTVVIIVTTLRSSLIDWNDVPTGSMIPTIVEGDRIVVNKLAYSFNLPFNGPVVSVPIVNVSFNNPLDFLPGFYYGTPERNDIVTFWKPGEFYEPSYDLWIEAGFTEEYALARSTPTDGGIRMVKRIVAVPGDTVEMKLVVEKFDGRPFEFTKLIINGEEAVYSDKKNIELTETIGGHTRRVRYARYTEVNAGDGRMITLPLHPPARAFGPLTLGEDEYFMIGDNRDNSADGRFFGPVKLDQITGKAKFVAVSFDGSYFNPNWSRFFHAFDSDLEQPATE